MTWQTLEIKSSPLILKPFTAEDADEIFNCITPNLTRYMSWEPPQNRQVFAATWQQWLRNIDHKTELTLVIRNINNNEFVGLTALHQVQSETPELGIWIREDRHGSGFGRSAIKALVEWASIHFHIKHFIYPVAVENTASRRIAESLGGTVYEQIQKPKYDAVTYAIPLSKTV